MLDDLTRERSSSLLREALRVLEGVRDGRA
jgi:hypothetical protein